MRGLLAVFSTSAFFIVTQAIPAEAPWTVVASADLNQDKEVVHDLATGSTTLASTSQTTSAYAAVTSCTTFHGEIAPYEPVTSCTTYHREQEQATTTTTASSEVCTPVYTDVEYCHPASVTGVPECDESFCTIPSTYVAQADMPMEISVASNTRKEYAPWLPGTNFDTSVLGASSSRLVGTMFVLKWQKYIYTQYEALNTTASQFQGQSFYKLDIDEDAVVARLGTLNIGASPTYIFWRNGKEVGRISGSVGTTPLMNKVRSLVT